MIEGGPAPYGDRGPAPSGDVATPARWWRPLLVATFLCILAATLWPLSGAGLPQSAYCLLCGARGLADAVLNVVMFVPLGFLLAGARQRPATPAGRFSAARWPIAAVALAVLLSVLIETAQLLVVPGRFASPADTLFNSIGALIGVLLFVGRHWLLEPEGHRRTVLAALAAALVAGTLFLTGWLLTPILPYGPYYSVWEPVRQGDVEFNGVMMGAAVGQYQARPGPHPYSAEIAQLLARGAPLGLMAQVGGPVEGRAPLLAIQDADGNDIVRLSIDGSDILYGERLRATGWQLVTPQLRVYDAMRAFDSGDTLRLATYRLPIPQRPPLIGSPLGLSPLEMYRRGGDGGRCIDLQGVATCGYGFSPGSGWGLLHDFRPPTPAASLALNGMWMALLLLPVGFLARPRAAAMLLLALLWYITIRLPFDTVLMPAVWPDIAGSAAGIATGLGARWLLQRPRAAPAPQPAPADELLC